MPPPTCLGCGGKWAVVGGGLCSVCRTVDRLAALARGPLVPRESEEELLHLLRSWVARLQDLGELPRGVVPSPQVNPSQFAAGLVPPPAEPGPGATSKAAAPPPAVEIFRPAPGGPLLPAGREGCPEVAGEGKGGPSSSARGLSLQAKAERSPASPVHREKKRSKKSRSGCRSSRSRRRRRSDKSPLASPVRPAGIKREREASPSPRDAPGVRPVTPPRRSPVREPRGPPRSPPRREHRERPEPTFRPEGRHWQGPIPARRPEPPPGSGRHYGKNKGASKRQRQRDFNNNRQWR